MFLAIYEEMEDDGLRAAFSPIAIQKKLSGMGNEEKESTVVEVPKVTVASTTRSTTPRPRKRKNKDRYDEPLQEFLAQWKKAKKQQKSGFQFMIMDYFKHSKPVIKVEKKDQPSTSRASTSTTDILDSDQYKFDPTTVPQDDDIEIIDEIPARDADARKSTPFVYVIPETQMDPIKEESKPECREADGEMAVTGETSSLNNRNHPVEEEPQSMETVSPAISLENEAVDEPEKPTEKETMLMQQVQELSRGMEEMKALINKRKRVETTAKLASKLKRKMLKHKRQKTAKPKPIFDKPVGSGEKLDEASEVPVSKQDEAETMKQPDSTGGDKAHETSEVPVSKQDEAEAINQPESAGGEKLDEASEFTPTKDDEALQPEPEAINEPQSGGTQISDTYDEAAFSEDLFDAKHIDHDYSKLESEEHEAELQSADNAHENDVEVAGSSETPVEDGQTRNEFLEGGTDGVENTDSQIQFTEQDELTDSQLIESTKYMNINDTEDSTSKSQIMFSAEVHLTTHSTDRTQGTQCTALEALAFLEENSKKISSEDLKPSQENQPDVESEPAQEKEVEVDRMITRSENDLLGEESQMSDVDEETARQLLEEVSQMPVKNTDEHTSSGASAEYNDDEVFGGEDEDELFPADDDNNDDLENYQETLKGDEPNLKPLPAFASIFSQQVPASGMKQQSSPVVHINTPIHPPGTNAAMQEVMKWRIPRDSVSSTCL